MLTAELGVFGVGRRKWPGSFGLGSIARAVTGLSWWGWLKLIGNLDEHLSALGRKGGTGNCVHVQSERTIFSLMAGTEINQPMSEPKTRVTASVKRIKDMHMNAFVFRYSFVRTATFL